MQQKIRHELIYGLVRSLQWVAAALPYGLLRWIGGWLGGGFHRWAHRDRERALANLRWAWPSLSESERQALVHRLFIHLGKNLFEFLKMASPAPGDVMTLVEAVEGREHMDRAWARGRGVLCLAAHIGHWEILPIATSRLGWPTLVVAQTLYDSRLDALLNRARERQGITVIRRGHVTGEIIRGLRANRVLGVLNDQDTNVDSRWVPFFGHPAKTPAGILRLARKTGAAVVPVFIARQVSGKHRIFIEPELVLSETKDEEADLVEGLAQCNHAIETFIRRFPDQWVWFHRRWKSPPPGADPLERANKPTEP